MFCNTDRRADKTEHYVKTLLEKRVDGIIIAGGGTDFTEASTAFAEYGAPVVFIGRHREGGHSVQISNAAAARDATAHLTLLGHQRDRLPRRAARAHERPGPARGLPRGPRRTPASGSTTGSLREGDFGERSGYEAARLLPPSSRARPRSSPPTT